ncbi:RNA polymerase sigma-70 factor [Maribacter algarum]|uniref:RNA polymerase sigma-70 factor n=1 Tax=Maribacter algarum (ex Zhang et al. 2020) TaxID=2578118 RepID=A0A5S3PMV2_9FLAO|nr:RNA polymerase sigma-70 factor [Maribacter algarum]TMM55798.1 RNA polymerase sigma-70 factor [Maribacter algarum]
MNFKLLHNDDDMIKALIKGNKLSFSMIYHAYHNQLCRFVYSFSMDKALAEDIVQQTFIDLWEKRDSLKIHTSLNAYLYRCVKNKYLKHIKKVDRQTSLIEELRLQAVVEIEELDRDIKEKRISAIEGLIETLPPKRKEIFILNKFQNYKYREIAEMQNISERTVESQIRKALITIREELKRIELKGLLSTLLFFFLH